MLVAFRVSNGVLTRWCPAAPVRSHCGVHTRLCYSASLFSHRRDPWHSIDQWLMSLYGRGRFVRDESCPRCTELFASRLSVCTYLADHRLGRVAECARLIRRAMRPPCRTIMSKSVGDRLVLESSGACRWPLAAIGTILSSLSWKRDGIRLYVRRLFCIIDDSGELIPVWLNFVKVM